jgi:NAD(P)-dependent dehydrogenase (short-subunit alcohol dehydrogenase family)
MQQIGESRMSSSNLGPGWTASKRVDGKVAAVFGAGQRPGDVVDITEEAFDHIYQTNSRATAFACEHALPFMRERRSGVIINISSAAAVGLFPYVAYKSTKAGGVALTGQLALRNAPFGIRVNALLPGLIDTPQWPSRPVRADGADLASNFWRNAAPRCRWAGKARPGMWLMLHCSRRPMSPASSPAYPSWSMVDAS